VFWVNQIKPAKRADGPAGGFLFTAIEARRLSQVEARRIFLRAALPRENHGGTHGIA